MNKSKPLIVHAWMSLNEVLDALGYRTAPPTKAIQQGKRILRRGEVVFEGTAGEVWTWLRKSGEIV